MQALNLKSQQSHSRKQPLFSRENVSLLSCEQPIQCSHVVKAHPSVSTAC